MGRDFACNLAIVVGCVPAEGLLAGLRIYADMNWLGAFFAGCNWL